MSTINTHSFFYGSFSFFLVVRNDFLYSKFLLQCVNIMHNKHSKIKILIITIINNNNILYYADS